LPTQSVPIESFQEFSMNKISTISFILSSHQTEKSVL